MVKVEHVSKSFKNSIALVDVSFEASEGITVIVGPNGAGKTTTLRCISGVIKPDSGKVEVFGKVPEKVKERIAFLNETRRSFRRMKVSDYEELYGLVYPNWNKKLFREMMVHFSIQPSRKVEDLSAGLRSLFHIALVLSSGADVLILDEPTQNLDPVKISEFERMMVEFSREKIVLVSTHHIEEVESLADEMVVIKEGKVIYKGGIDEAKDSHRLVPPSDVDEDDDVISKIDGEFLVRISRDKGRYPSLREIVVAYLRSTEIT